MKSDKKLNIFLISTHFCPMPLSPLEKEKVNEYNFRKELSKRKYNYNGKTIFVYWNGNQCTSPISALEECILFRADKLNLELIEKILLSSKYRNLRMRDKIKVIKQFFPYELYGQRENKVLNYIQYPKGFDKAQKQYYRNKELYL